MKKMQGELVSHKNFMIKLLLVFMFLYYFLQYSNLNHFILMCLLLFSYLIFPFVMLAKGYSNLNIALRGLLLALIYIITAMDSRFLSLGIIYMVLENENIKEYFQSLLYISIFSLISILFIGYHHLNGLSIVFSLCIYLFCYVYPAKSLRQQIIIMIILNLLIMFFIPSGQALVCINIFLFLNLMRFSKFAKKIRPSKILTFIYPLCAFFNVYLSVSLNEIGLKYINTFLPNFINNFIHLVLQKVDMLMNFRLSLSNVSLNLFGYKLYGNVLNANHPLIKDQYFNVDSGYLLILQCQGLIVLLIVLFLLSIIVLYFIKTKQYYWLIVAISSALWIINEDIIVSIIGNFIWLFLPEAIQYFKKNYQNKKGKNIYESRNS